MLCVCVGWGCCLGSVRCLGFLHFLVGPEAFFLKLESFCAAMCARSTYNVITLNQENLAAEWRDRT